MNHIYTLDGTKILCEKWDNNTIVPLYDNEDSVCGIVYNDEPFYFQKNLQGDVIGIVDKDAQSVAKYSYDAWGVCTIVSDTSDIAIATINPYRYRGYYYDPEIGMYYLQSRYYNPVVGRFVNGDSVEYLGTGSHAHELNVFVYCNNDPVQNDDPMGFDSRDPWKEYWGTFNSRAITRFTTKLDQLAQSARNQNVWIDRVVVVGGVVLSIWTGFWAGLAYTLFSLGISRLINLYPDELGTISLKVRSAYEKYKKALIIYFLFASHDNQIKIVNSVTKKTYAIITIYSNIIDKLVRYAKESGVKIKSKSVKWGYAY